jgi:hypothetical protein
VPVVISVGKVDDGGLHSTQMPPNGPQGWLGSPNLGLKMHWLLEYSFPDFFIFN